MRRRKKRRRRMRRRMRSRRFRPTYLPPFRGGGRGCRWCLCRLCWEGFLLSFNCCMNSSAIPPAPTRALAGRIADSRDHVVCYMPSPKSRQYTVTLPHGIFLWHSNTVSPARTSLPLFQVLFQASVAWRIFIHEQHLCIALLHRHACNRSLSST